MKNTTVNELKTMCENIRKELTRLYEAEGSYYTITKIEYDFAVYMMEKSV